MLSSRRRLLCVLGGLLAVPGGVLAQRSAKPSRIGFVLGGPLASRGSNLEVFRQGMRELGYREGTDFVLEVRAPEHEEDARFDALVADLVRRGVDLLVVQATGPILAAKRATSTVPIVMAPASDPVGTGIVESIARPGGNITGVSLLSEELSGKRLQLLSEMVPGLSRVAVIWNPDNPSVPPELRRVEAAARMLKVQLHNFDVRQAGDIERAFDAAAKSRSGGMLILEDRFLLGFRQRITGFALKHRLPAVYAQTPFAEVGGLAVYAPDLYEMIRRSAGYVDRILKGAKPGELPVEQPTKFELVVNLKTAKAIGLTIPQSILLRADRVIE